MNIGACVLGLVLYALLRRRAPSPKPTMWYVLAGASLAAILATFAFAGVDGVHRWVSLGGIALHVSAIVAPLLIACVATAPRPYLGAVIAIATALLLALQPDAAQTISFAAACMIIPMSTRERIVSVIALLACAIVSLMRADPLSPVRHVEEIYEAAVARGPLWAVLATVALLLLPLPFLWRRHRVALALGVYIAMVTIAPLWGTFPVPVMGYGVSPILGYYLALVMASRAQHSRR